MGLYLEQKHLTPERFSLTVKGFYRTKPFNIEQTPLTQIMI
jgi:hypothetical protein